MAKGLVGREGRSQRSPELLGPALLGLRCGGPWRRRWQQPVPPRGVPGSARNRAPAQAPVRGVRPAGLAEPGAAAADPVTVPALEGGEAPPTVPELGRPVPQGRSRGSGEAPAPAQALPTGAALTRAPPRVGCPAPEAGTASTAVPELEQPAGPPSWEQARGDQRPPRVPGLSRQPPWPRRLRGFPRSPRDAVLFRVSARVHVLGSTPRSPSWQRPGLRHVLPDTGSEVEV